MSEKLTTFFEIPINSEFPLNNLPYGIFKTPENLKLRVGVAIGEKILDLSILEKVGIFDKSIIGDETLFDQTHLNKFMKKGKKVWDYIRNEVTNLLSGNNPKLKNNEEMQKDGLINQSDAEMELPVKVGDYTDFYASRYHAFNVGTMFRGPENALMPNWLHLPVGYHGRASSIILSGVDIKRPSGQKRPVGTDKPIFGPSKRLDYEFEMGFFVGTGNDLGSSLPVNEANDNIFGMVIVNDWSARDIQGWEYVPLGPFNAKNFATSISPWVVPLAALEPFQIELEKQDPEVLPYLKENTRVSYDIVLEVFLKTKKMKNEHKISESNFKYLYWTMAQMLAHHSSTGCNMTSGDLLGSGTISGPEKFNRSCMLELSWKGEEPIELPNGESRTFLEDGDTVIMRAYAEKNGLKIGFGEVRSTILANNP